MKDTVLAMVRMHQHRQRQRAPGAGADNNSNLTRVLRHAKIASERNEADGGGAQGADAAGVDAVTTVEEGKASLQVALEKWVQLTGDLIDQASTVSAKTEKAADAAKPTTTTTRERGATWQML